MSKLIIEARVNEYAMRSVNPNVPWTPEEIAKDAVACREAGASILHFHARKPDGAPEHGYEGYRDTIARVRAASDILVHPTLGAQTVSKAPEERIGHIFKLVEDGLAPDFAPLDIVSSNADEFDPVTGRYLTEDTVYVNSTRTLHFFAKETRARGVRPYAVAWNIPSLRQALSFVNNGTLPAPLVVSLSMTEGSFLSGHPGTLEGLQAYLPFLPKDGTVEWGVTLYGGNMFPLVGAIATLGGHISIGLGDYPYAELGTPTNAEVIRRVAAIARDCGREIATPAETREILRMQPASSQRAA